jgi:hypothetical protein
MIHKLRHVNWFCHAIFNDWFSINEELPALKFFGAQRMSNMFNRITKAMCVVIGRINAPFVSCSVMWQEFYPVSHRVLFSLF